MVCFFFDSAREGVNPSVPNAGGAGPRSRPLREDRHFRPGLPSELTLPHPAFGCCPISVFLQSVTLGWSDSSFFQQLTFSQPVLSRCCVAFWKKPGPCRSTGGVLQKPQAAREMPAVCEPPSTETRKHKQTQMSTNEQRWQHQQTNLK